MTFAPDEWNTRARAACTYTQEKKLWKFSSPRIISSISKIQNHIQANIEPSLEEPVICNWKVDMHHLKLNGLFVHYPPNVLHKNILLSLQSIRHYK